VIRSRAVRILSLAVPVAAVSASFAGTAAFAAGSAPAATAPVTWHKLTLINGWQSSQSTRGTGDPSYAIKGGMVYLSGALHGGSADSVFAVLPKAARPAGYLYMTVSTAGGIRGTLRISHGGQMLVYGTPAANPTKLASLAAVSFPAAATSQHKLALVNGWTSAQAPYGTGDPSYVVKNGIVHLSGSVKGGTDSGFAYLPTAPLPAVFTYRGVYTYNSTYGAVIVNSHNFLEVAQSDDTKMFTSLAGISLPLKSVIQHKVTLLNGWKSAQQVYSTAPFSYAVKDGIVYLSGAVRRASGTSNVIAVLPKAARPAHVLYISAYTAFATPGALVIRPNGRVSITSPTDPSGAPTLTSLAAISYPKNS
jgi:hypothetical protein